MNAALIVAIVSVLGSLVLALNALRVRRIAMKTGVAMAAAWLVIFVCVAVLAAKWGV